MDCKIFLETRANLQRQQLKEHRHLKIQNLSSKMGKPKLQIVYYKPIREFCKTKIFLV